MAIDCTTLYGTGRATGIPNTRVQDISNSVRVVDQIIAVASLLDSYEIMTFGSIFSMLDKQERL